MKYRVGQIYGRILHSTDDKSKDEGGRRKDERIAKAFSFDSFKLTTPVRRVESSSFIPYPSSLPFIVLEAGGEEECEERRDETAEAARDD